jgi:hypothetical protein
LENGYSTQIHHAAPKVDLEDVFLVGNGLWSSMFDSSDTYFSEISGDHQSTPKFYGSSSSSPLKDDCFDPNLGHLLWENQTHEAPTEDGGAFQTATAGLGGVLPPCSG